MTKDDINVDIEDDQIIIQGERRDERESNEQGFYHTERSYGSFYRSIPLPQGIDAEVANASFNNGVLEITMPKPERKQRGRRLEIGEGNKPANKQTPAGKSQTANQ
jgi:HSP20 family protein